MFTALSTLNFEIGSLVHLMHLQYSFTHTKKGLFFFLKLAFCSIAISGCISKVQDWDLVMQVRWKIPPSRDLTTAAGKHSNHSYYLSGVVIYTSCRWQLWQFQQQYNWESAVLWRWEKCRSFNLFPKEPSVIVQYLKVKFPEGICLDISAPGIPVPIKY